MKKHLFLAFLIITVDFIAFGIIVPILPYFAKSFGSSAFSLGLLMSSFSIMQFLFSPFWGSLSDHIGRRPVLLVTLLGTSVSHVLFALSGSFYGLLMTRSLNGFFGANISTVQAMISDITSPKDRSKNMGLIGAAIGLGFFLGPFLGGVLSEVGGKMTSLPNGTYALPVLVSAVLSFIGFLMGYFSLTETYEDRKTLKSFALTPKPLLKKFFSMKQYITKPLLGSLLSINSLFQTAFSCMEVAFFLFLIEKLNLSVRLASFGFAYVGFIIIFMNGFVVRRIIPLLGERSNIIIGLLLSGSGFFIMAHSENIFPGIFIALTLMGASGMTTPSLLGTLSLLCHKNQQGVALGVNQSMASIGRILGPLLGGWSYQLAPTMPFFLSCALIVLALILFLKDFTLWPSTGQRKRLS